MSQGSIEKSCSKNNLEETSGTFNETIEVDPKSIIANTMKRLRPPSICCGCVPLFSDCTPVVLRNLVVPVKNKYRKKEREKRSGEKVFCRSQHSLPETDSKLVWTLQEKHGKSSRDFTEQELSRIETCDVSPSRRRR
ncbi:hypothetical protein HAX54_040733 [Datura stramonium]|uniref:Uncharacterized protein n=1 Tax=Datura stramonium TaxID=4076 RepID=A0ABS8SKC0_DATST|nr:hypothetical protein [Datura stramonium]